MRRMKWGTFVLAVTLAGCSRATPEQQIVNDAAEAGVLARDADAGVHHDRGQEARLALREAPLGDGLSALIEGQRKSSACPRARPPPRPLPPPRPEK